MNSSTRRQMKKASRSGLRAAVRPAAETQGLRQLWYANATRQGLESDLSNVLRIAGTALQELECGFVMEVVDGNGELHAAGLFGFDEHRVYYLAGASDPEQHGSGAPTLPHTEVFAEIERRGLVRCYDWVGANTESIARFKRGFGPETEILVSARRLSRTARVLLALH